jgi:hypothetical protein
MAQVIECLPIKHEARVQKSITPPKKKIVLSGINKRELLKEPNEDKILSCLGD